MGPRQPAIGGRRLTASGGWSEPAANLPFGTMATKAERFKSRVQRSGAKPPKDSGKATKNQRRKTRGAEGNRELGPADPTPHNLAAGEKNAKTYEYEASAAGKPPSRKSTRASEAHVKHGVEQQIRQQYRIHSPAGRATRARKGGS
jgi:hypothetical protein